MSIILNLKPSDVAAIQQILATAKFSSHISQKGGLYLSFDSELHLSAEGSKQFSQNISAISARISGALNTHHAKLLTQTFGYAFVFKVGDTVDVGSANDFRGIRFQHPDLANKPVISANVFSQFVDALLDDKLITRKKAGELKLSSAEVLQSSSDSKVVDLLNGVYKLLESTGFVSSKTGAQLQQASVQVLESTTHEDDVSCKVDAGALSC